MREQQARRTNAAVLDAATACFVRRGYALTTMKDIAETAGVSAQTVYLQGNKVSLLLAAAGRSFTGDGAELSAPGRGPAQRLLDQPDRARKLRLVAAVMRVRLPVSFPILRVFREAAPTDPVIAEAWAEHERTRYRDVRTFVESCEHLLRPGVGIDRATDIVWAAIIYPPVVEALISERGWSITEYVEWAVHTFDRLLLTDP
ncbi:MAG TPA: helix-turn-helix domain-containing protein [Pseudonocardia sp.]|nr:helix-turn-helix domain-containing protein [Pseudonocardia sp.]